MTTSIYPTAVRTFVDHQDYVEIVDASHVNALQAEVTAIEATLGVQPEVYAPIGTKATSYASVGARLDAHEAELAEQQVTINQILAAEKDGWLSPACYLTGVSTPAVRVLAGSPTLINTTSPSPVGWSGAQVNIGNMWVPNANVVSCPKGGVWLVRASIAAITDWTTLDSTQSYYNNLRTNPTPLAYQRLGIYLYVGGVLRDYEFALVHWTPSSERPATSLTINISVGWLGTVASGTQIQVFTEQYYGHIANAAVIMNATFQQTVTGVN